MGKIAFKDLKDMLSCIKTTSKVVVPPTPGFDAGVHYLDEDTFLVIATDPCVGVPERWFSWLLVNYAASDVALFGAKPKYCSVNLLGPIDTKAQTFKSLMKEICKSAEELGITIITGHTGTYEGIETLLGTCTAYGTVEKEKLVTPAGAKPGNLILCTKSIGLETLTNFVLTRKETAEKLFGKRRTRYLAGQVKMQSCVSEALLLADTGAVYGMHDATEGGVVAALNELAETSNVGFHVDYGKLPFPPELNVLGKHYNLSRKQVMSTSSTGTILAAVSAEKLVEITRKLRAHGVKFKVIGVFSDKKERKIKYDGREEHFPVDADDPYTSIMKI